MRRLLDTHALLWWLSGDAQLPLQARGAIAAETNTAFVSAASAWEVATIRRIGKLPGAGPLSLEFGREVRAQGFTPLAISLEHGQAAGSLSSAHSDPFDRMLIAQALDERMALVSNEKLFDDFALRGFGERFAAVLLYGD
jgi:PIN domain nuclease of toxin-antitoxin system